MRKPQQRSMEFAAQYKMGRLSITSDGDCTSLTSSRLKKYGVMKYPVWKSLGCLTCVIAIGYLVILTLCLLYLWDMSRQTLRRPIPDRRNNVAVMLLIWTHPFSLNGTLPDCQALYGIRGCQLTDDRRAYPRADAVVIHHGEISSNVSLLPPDPRPHMQKWIWMNFESPSHTHRLWQFEGKFNLTMTYRKDSDISLPYGYLIPRPRGSAGIRRPIASRPRPGLVAWVISNWSESHARVAFYKELSRYVQVDVFGGVGKPLPQGVSVVQLAQRYRFYLALENSQHTDYITEKLWNAVLAGAVPVVLGPPRKNYERFLPPEAFIHVEDFPTVWELAQYLLELRRHPARLQRHLDWRGSYDVHQPTFWSEHYCAACPVVSASKDTPRMVTDLTRWFYSV